MKKLLQINPVIRQNTSTGRIMLEIGQEAMLHGWESYIAYSQGRDGKGPSSSKLIPVGNHRSVVWHGLVTRLADRHGLASDGSTRRLIDEIERLQPDVIHIHNIHGYFLNYRILFDYLSRCDIPVVWTVHDCWLYTGHCYYYSFIGCDKWQTGCGQCPQRGKFPASWFVDRSHENYMDKKAAFTSLREGQLTIVPVSHWIKSEMEHSFLRGCRFRVIHNGINTEVFQPHPTNDILDLLGLSGKHILLGAASIWSEEKGLNDFLQMASMLHDDERIVLVGVSEKIKRQLPENIVGICRTENLCQLAELYSASAAFINPTWQDNYPTVNMESISCGTPVVTYRTGGSVEAVTPHTGFVVAQGDVNALLEKARLIIRQGKESWQPNCRAHALEHFRKEDRYAEYLSLYEELSNNR